MGGEAGFGGWEGMGRVPLVQIGTMGQNTIIHQTMACRGFVTRLSRLSDSFWHAEPGRQGGVEEGKPSLGFGYGGVEGVWKVFLGDKAMGKYGKF